MNLQGIPKGRPESPLAEPSPTKTTALFSAGRSLMITTQPSTISPTPSACSTDPKDDLEIMLLHEEFPNLLCAAADLKEIREHIATHRDQTDEEGETVVVPVFQQIAKSNEHNNQVINALDRMQKALLVSNNNYSHRGQEGKIPVGRYPVIDSVLEDAIAKLQQEYECCEAWIQKQFPTTQAGGISSYKKRERNALAIKYPKAQTDILMEWMIANREDPFPSDDDLCALAERTGLTTSQVVNWTTNVRKRNRKAVLDNKKKPHHFIDFLFLVQERENKKEESRRMYAWQQRKAPEQPYPLSQEVAWPRSTPDLHRSPIQYPCHPHHQAPSRHEPQRYSESHGRINSLHRRSTVQLFSPLQGHSVPSHRNESSHSYPTGSLVGTTPPDMAVPDGCISKRIFDEVEDLAASAKHYDDLMGNAHIEEWEVEGTAPAEEEYFGHRQYYHDYRPKYHHASPQQQQQQQQQQCLMPSVTMDSNDGVRQRVSSLDIEVEHQGKDIDEFVTQNITTHDEIV